MGEPRKFRVYEIAIREIKSFTTLHDETWERLFYQFQYLLDLKNILSTSQLPGHIILSKTEIWFNLACPTSCMTLQKLCALINHMIWLVNGQIALTATLNIPCGGIQLTELFKLFNWTTCSVLVCITTVFFLRTANRYK